MVQRYYNPYDFINPVRDPKLFAGRQEELEEKLKDKQKRRKHKP